jgi:hypothetical protein
MDELDVAIEIIRDHASRRERMGNLAPGTRRSESVDISRVPDLAPAEISVTTTIPSWNRETGELRLNDRLVKHIKNIKQAVNVIRILDAFERDGWPEVMGDPLPYATERKRRERLGEALKSLNCKLVGLRFLRNGSTQCIRWVRRPAPDGTPTLP